MVSAVRGFVDKLLAPVEVATSVGAFISPSQAVAGESTTFTVVIDGSSREVGRSFEVTLSESFVHPRVDFSTARAIGWAHKFSEPDASGTQQITFHAPGVVGTGPGLSDGQQLIVQFTATVLAPGLVSIPVTGFDNAHLGGDSFTVPALSVAVTS